MKGVGVAVLQAQLVEDGTDLSEVRVTLSENADHDEYTVTVEAVNRLGHRWSKSARVRRSDVAGLEHIPDALRDLGLGWLYDDPTTVAADFIRSVKKGRRPSQ